MSKQQVSTRYIHRLLLFLLFVTTAVNAEDMSECRTINECVMQLSAIAPNEVQRQTEIVNTISGMGDGVLPYLLPLTATANRHQRQLADQLISSLWWRYSGSNSALNEALYLAAQNSLRFAETSPSFTTLGKLGSPAIGRLLQDELSQLRFQHTSLCSVINAQKTAFFKLIADADISYQRSLFVLVDDCFDKNEIRDDQLANALLNKPWQLKFEDIQRGESHYNSVIDNATKLSGYFGQSDLFAQRLQQRVLATKYGAYSEEFEALLQMRSSRALPFLLAPLYRDFHFEQFVRMGHVAAPLIPLLEPWFFNTNSVEREQLVCTVYPSRPPFICEPYLTEYVHKRIEDYTGELKGKATIALAAMGDKKIEPAVLKMLSAQDDWRKVARAIYALSLLNSTEALTPLMQVAEEYWFPPVRQLAAYAIANINQRKAPELQKEILLKQPYFVPRAEQKCTIANWPRFNATIAAKPIDTPAQETRFQYRDPRCEKYGYRQDGSCEAGYDLRIPDSVIKLDNGWLAGRDGGEFGGELMWFSTDEKPALIQYGNVINLFVIGSSAYIVSGDSHLGANNGVITVWHRQHGQFTMTRRVILPGWPYSAWQVTPNKILLNTLAGSVLFTPNKPLQMTQCFAATIERKQRLPRLQ